MKTFKTLSLVLLTAIALYSCSEEELPTTGEVTIIFDNQTLTATDNLFVEGELVYSESDGTGFKELGRYGLSNGGKATIGPFDLDPGDYFVRFQYYLNNSFLREREHRPLSVEAGKESQVKIVM